MEPHRNHDSTNVRYYIMDEFLRDIAETKETKISSTTFINEVMR